MSKYFLLIGLLLLIPAIWASDEKPPESIMKESKAVLEQLASLPYRIVYETYENNNWELYSIKADGSDPINLTDTPNVHEMYPHVSPDGSKICFVSDKTSNDITIRCVYYMNVDGSNRTLVAERSRQPCWSPDGKTIAYLHSEYDRLQTNDYATKGIAFYDLASKRHREHPNNEKIHHLYNLCWAKNGRWFVATVHGGMGYSHTNLAIEVDGMHIYDLGIGGCRPDLNPDGKRIAWGETDNIISVADIDFDADVPTVSNIKHPIVDDKHVYHVDWSPDGKYLCYSRGVGGLFQKNGPGTNRGIAELVGVRGIWSLCVTPSSGGGDYTQVTKEGITTKEADWYIPAKLDQPN
ncbi:MAG: PD40 domain-containing protein [Candidatus Omnitrophica bacterium]|nr:PD40 domain-containing protein [Candidatus Omnitrophota bacterium]